MTLNEKIHNRRERGFSKACAFDCHEKDEAKLDLLPCDGMNDRELCTCSCHFKTIRSKKELADLPAPGPGRNYFARGPFCFGHSETSAAEALRQAGISKGDTRGTFEIFVVADDFRISHVDGRLSSSHLKKVAEFIGR